MARKTDNVPKVMLRFAHYSKLQCVLLAAAMTSTTSQVLLGYISWPSTIIVGLGVYVIYSLDNIVDYYGEQEYLGLSRLLWRPYRTITVFGIGVSLVSIFALAHKNYLLMALLAFLCFISVFQVVLTRQTFVDRKLFTVIFVERIMDATVWALTSVLVPVIYSGFELRPQVFMTFLFVFMLSWNMVMIWDITRAATNGQKHPTPVLSDYISERRILLVITILCISSLFLATIDIVLGFFPWYNISVLFAPISHLILIPVRVKMKYNPVLYSNIFLFSSIIASIIIVLVYNLFETRPSSLEVPVNISLFSRGSD